MVRAFLRSVAVCVVAAALGFLLAFLLWRGLTLECPELEEEEDSTATYRVNM